jgi:plastocyanin
VRFAITLTAMLLLGATTQAGVVRGRVTLKDKGGKPAADVSGTVVFIDGIAAQAPLVRASVTMRGKAFEPKVVVTTVGSTIDFPNDDPILHNVFSVTSSNPFDLQLYKKPKSSSWTFAKPGIVKIYCNIHPQMSGVIVVRDNPFYARPADDGSFAIEGVPPGRYTIRAWHDRGGEATQSVDVGRDGASDVTLALDASKFKWIPHRNKFGKAYPDGERY